MGRPKGVAEAKPRRTKEKINRILEAIGTAPKTLEELSSLSGLTPTQTGEAIADMIREHNLILWDGKKYFTLHSTQALMDFAAEYPQHFMTILYVWRLGVAVKLKL